MSVALWGLTSKGGLGVRLFKFSDLIFQIFRGFEGLVKKALWGRGRARMGLRACLSRLPWARYAIDTILYFTGKHLPQISFMYVISFILFLSYRKQLSTKQSCKRFNNSLLVPRLEADHMISMMCKLTEVQRKNIVVSSLWAVDWHLSVQTLLQGCHSLWFPHFKPTT